VRLFLEIHFLAICYRPSVCHLCLSVICNVRAPYSFKQMEQKPRETC